MQVPRKRKASDPEENFEVDEHGNLIKDYGASPDIPSLSVGVSKILLWLQWSGTTLQKYSKK